MRRPEPRRAPPAPPRASPPAGPAPAGARALCKTPGAGNVETWGHAGGPRGVGPRPGMRTVGARRTWQARGPSAAGPKPWLHRFASSGLGFCLNIGPRPLLLPTLRPAAFHHTCDAHCLRPCTRDSKQRQEPWRSHRPPAGRRPSRPHGGPRQLPAPRWRSGRLFVMQRQCGLGRPCPTRRWPISPTWSAGRRARSRARSAACLSSPASR